MRALLEEQVSRIPTPQVREHFMALLEEQDTYHFRLHDKQQQIQALRQSLANSQNYCEALQTGNQKHMAVISGLQKDLAKARKDATEKKTLLQEKENQSFRLSLLLNTASERSKVYESELEQLKDERRNSKTRYQQDCTALRKEIECELRNYHEINQQLQNYKELSQSLKIQNDHLSEKCHGLVLEKEQLVSKLSSTTQQLSGQLTKGSEQQSQMATQSKILATLKLKLQQAHKKPRLTVKLLPTINIEIRDFEQKWKMERHELVAQKQELMKQKQELVTQKQELVMQKQELVMQKQQLIRGNSALECSMHDMKEDYELRLRAVADKICQLQDLQEELNSNSTKNGQLEQALQQAVQRIVELQSLLNESKEQTNNLLQEYHHMQCQHGRLISRSQNIEHSHQQLKDQNQELKRVIIKCEERLIAIEKRTEKKRGNKENAFKLESFLGRVGSVRTGVSTCRSQYQN